LKFLCRPTIFVNQSVSGVKQTHFIHIAYFTQQNYCNAKINLILVI